MLKNIYFFVLFYAHIALPATAQNISFKWVVDPTYDFVYSSPEPFKNGFSTYNKDFVEQNHEMAVYSDGSTSPSTRTEQKTGIINKQGKLITPPKYDGCGTFSNGRIAIEIRKKYGFVDETGKEVIPARFDESHGFSKESGFAIVRIGDKWGVIDKTGKEMIAIQYRSISMFAENLFIATTSDYKYVLFNKKNETLISTQYDKIEVTQEDFVLVNTNGQWGAVDKMGKVIVPLLYNEVKYHLSEGMIGVRQNDKWGFFDTNGKLVINTEYDDVREFSEGLAAVKKNKKYGFINMKGELVIPFQYNSADNFAHGLARVRLEKYGAIDKTGKLVVPAEYDNMHLNMSEYNKFSGNSVLIVAKNEKYGMVDKTNKVVIPLKYGIGLLQHGLARIGSESGVGVVNDKGKIIVMPEYDDVFPHDNSYDMKYIEIIPTKLKEKFGFVNREGVVIAPPKYEQFDFFQEGLAKVSLEGKYGYIDKTGKEIIPPQFEDAQSFSDGVAWVKMNGKWGIIKKP